MKNITRTRTCPHLFIHIPTATRKWRCVKCGASRRSRPTRNVVYPKPPTQDDYAP